MLWAWVFSPETKPGRRQLLGNTAVNTAGHTHRTNTHLPVIHSSIHPSPSSSSSSSPHAHAAQNGPLRRPPAGRRPHGRRHPAQGGRRAARAVRPRRRARPPRRLPAHVRADRVPPPRARPRRRQRRRRDRRHRPHGHGGLDRRGRLGGARPPPLRAAGPHAHRVVPALRDRVLRGPQGLPRPRRPPAPVPPGPQLRPHAPVRRAHLAAALRPARAAEAAGRAAGRRRAALAAARPPRPLPLPAPDAARHPAPAGRAGAAPGPAVRHRHLHAGHGRAPRRHAPAHLARGHGARLGRRLRLRQGRRQLRALAHGHPGRPPPRLPPGPVAVRAAGRVHRGRRLQLLRRVEAPRRRPARARHRPARRQADPRRRHPPQLPGHCARAHGRRAASHGAQVHHRRAARGGCRGAHSRSLCCRDCLLCLPRVANPPSRQRHQHPHGASRPTRPRHRQGQGLAQRHHVRPRAAPLGCRHSRKGASKLTARRSNIHTPTHTHTHTHTHTPAIAVSKREFLFAVSEHSRVVRGLCPAWATLSLVGRLFNCGKNRLMQTWSLANPIHDGVGTR